MTHKPSKEKQHDFELLAMPYGGYLVRQGKYWEGLADSGRNPNGFYYVGLLACFTELAEALDWINQNAARPAQTE